MVSRHCFFLTTGIGEKFGGRTNAIFQRARLMNQKAKLPIDILTFKFILNFDDLVWQMYNERFITKRTKIMNMFEYFDDGLSFQMLRV